MTKKEKEEHRVIAEAILAQMEMLKTDNIVIVKSINKIKYRVETVGFLFAVVAILFVLKEFV